jgi:hypothetical protein
MMASPHAVGMPRSTVSAPVHVGVSGASARGIHDVLLGGHDHQAADRTAAGELLRLVPDAVNAAYQNREFIRRAAGFLAGEAGIGQFMVIGTGPATLCDVHEVARRAAPGSRVVYGDSDRVALSHAQHLLAGDATAAVIDHDPADPAGLFRHPGPIDADQPVAVLLTALHFIGGDEGPHDIVRTFTSLMAPDSYLVLSHVTADSLKGSIARMVRELYRSTGRPVVHRTRAEIGRFLDGLVTVPPGLINGSAWRPGYATAEPRRTLFYAGLGRKP